MRFDANALRSQRKMKMGQNSGEIQRLKSIHVMKQKSKVESEYLKKFRLGVQENAQTTVRKLRECILTKSKVLYSSRQMFRVLYGTKSTFSKFF